MDTLTQNLRHRHILDRADKNLTSTPFEACPNCYEENTDNLHISEDQDKVTCLSCGTEYNLPN